MPDTKGQLNPDLQFTEAQSEEFDRLLEIRAKQGLINKTAKSDDKLVEIAKISLDLSEGQIRRVPGLLYGLVEKWEVLYMIHMADILDTDPETIEIYRNILPKGMSDKDYLFERDLSMDERYAIFWGFHARDRVLNNRANSMILYENLGTIRKRLNEDVIKKKSNYYNRVVSYQTSDIVSPADYFNEIVKDLYYFYNYYDIRKGTLFNTTFTNNVSASIQRMQKFEHPMGMNAEDQRLIRRVKAALEVLGDDADDMEVFRYLQEKQQERTGRKKTDEGGEILDVRRALQRVRSGEESYVSLDLKVGSEEEDNLGDIVNISATSEGFRNPEAEVIERDRIEDLMRSVRQKLERMSRVMFSCILDVYELESSGKMGQAEIDRLSAGKKPKKKALTTKQRIKAASMAKFRMIYPDAPDYTCESFFEKVANVFHGEIIRFVSTFDSRAAKGSGIAAALVSLDNYDNTYRLFAEDSVFFMKDSLTADMDRAVMEAELLHEDDPENEYEGF